MTCGSPLRAVLLSYVFMMLPSMMALSATNKVDVIELPPGPTFVSSGGGARVKVRLSSTNSASVNIGIELLSISTNEYAQVRVLGTGEMYAVRPPECVATNRFGPVGLRLIEVSYSNQTAVFSARRAIMTNSPDANKAIRIMDK